MPAAPRRMFSRSAALARLGVLSCLGLLALRAAVGTAAAQPAPADTTTMPPITEAHFRVYTQSGQPADLAAVLDAMRRADVVFLGEQHDDPVAHYLQARLLEQAVTAYGTTRPVVLSLEMFERDVQGVLDEYLAGLIRERDFLAAARPWSNYRQDYRPLIETARERRLAVLAANAPGRYVNRVGRLGPDALDSLSAAARTTLPPLPVAPASPMLADKFRGLMAGMGGHGGAATMNIDHMLAAQNLRDAAMGHALARHLDAAPGALVLHVNGSFHSESGLGVPEHLARYRPGTRVLLVTMVPVADPAHFDAAAHDGLGNFVFLTDASLPRSFGS